MLIERSFMEKALQAKSKDKWQTGRNIAATYTTDKELTFPIYKALRSREKQRFRHTKNISTFKHMNFVLTREMQINSTVRKFFQLYCMFEKVRNKSLQKATWRYHFLLTDWRAFKSLKSYFSVINGVKFGSELGVLDDILLYES